MTNFKDSITAMVNTLHKSTDMSSLLYTVSLITFLDGVDCGADHGTDVSSLSDV